MDEQEQRRRARHEGREDARSHVRLEGRGQKLAGRVISALGAAMALAGDLTPGDVGPAGPIGLLMGLLGYLLGARVLGAAAAVLALLEILVGALTG